MQIPDGPQIYYNNMQDCLSATDTPLFGIYSPEVPEFINRIASAPELLKLSDVGMHCGCEYTSLPRFSGLAHSSRYSHSIGVGLIVWNFTRKPAQAIAGLLHDIATPAFSHVVDFLCGDHMKQESTENRTSEIIRSSQVITDVLSDLGLDVSDVDDYHLYPIADNDSPKLSADRLEYTLGNILNFRLGTTETVRRIYDSIEVGLNEYGETELVFTDPKAASDFAFFALECGKVYTCDDDRYAMQTLAEVLRSALRKGVLTPDLLYLTESEIIEKLKCDAECGSMWNIYCAMNEVRRYAADEATDANIDPETDSYSDSDTCACAGVCTRECTNVCASACISACASGKTGATGTRYDHLRRKLLVPRIINAKKRYIDPYVAGGLNMSTNGSANYKNGGLGRVSSFDPAFKKAVGEFLSAGQDYSICGDIKAV